MKLKLSADVEAIGSNVASVALDVRGDEFNIQEDNRSVTINRSGAPVAKLESDTDLNKDRDEWVEADGTRHGHTTYSYFDGDRNGVPELTQHVPNFQTFNANRSGYWGNPLTWQWQPSETGGHMGTGGPMPPAADSINAHEQEMPDGSLDKNAAGAWIGTKSGVQEKIISYTVKDGADGARAKTQYAIKLHDPYEVKDLVSDDPRFIVKTLLPGKAAASNHIIAGVTPATRTFKFGFSTEANTTDEWTHTESRDASLSGALGADAGKASPFLSGLGIDMSVKAEAKIAVADQDKSTQLNSQGFNYSLDQEIPLPPGYESWPIIDVISRRRVYNVWLFAASGFTGEGQMTIDTYDDRPIYDPHWAPLKALPNGQGGPPPPAQP